MITSNVLFKNEIVETLEPLNNRFFFIDNLHLYEEKILNKGKCLVLRCSDNAELLSYVLYYDNQPEVFVSMVWTNPEHRGKGFALNLLETLAGKSNKDILLSVHADNPAHHLYMKMGFRIDNKKDGHFILKKRCDNPQPEDNRLSQKWEWN